MENKLRGQLVECLTDKWGEYVSRLKGYEEAELDSFLKQQGYDRLLDLLAHITAWWQAGMQKIAAFQQDPGYETPEINIDEFNAQAVKEVRDRPELAVIESFETTRLQFLELILDLSERDFQNDKIVNQLKMEIIGHYSEHQIN